MSTSGVRSTLEGFHDLCGGISLFMWDGYIRAFNID